MSNFIKIQNIDYVSLNKYPIGTEIDIVTNNINQIIGTIIILSKEQIKHYSIIKTLENIDNKIRMYDYIYSNGVSWSNNIELAITTNAQNDIIIGTIFELYSDIFDTKTNFISENITVQQLKESNTQIYNIKHNDSKLKTSGYCKMKQEIILLYKNNQIAVIKTICSSNLFSKKEGQSETKFKYIEFPKDVVN